MLHKVLFALILACSINVAVADNDTISMCIDMVKQQHKNQITNKQAESYCQCSVPKIEALTDEIIEKNMPQSAAKKRMLNIANHCMNKAGIGSKSNNKTTENNTSATNNAETTKANNTKANNTNDKKTQLAVPSIK